MKEDETAHVNIERAGLIFQFCPISLVAFYPFRNYLQAPATCSASLFPQVGSK